jgi:hypothetical protein
VKHIDTGHQLEQFSGHVWHAADAGRTEADPPWVGLCVADELGNILGRECRVDHQHERHGHEPGDRRNVTCERKGEPAIQGRVDRVDRSNEQYRVSVGRRTDDRLRGQVRAGARFVLNDDLLTQAFRQPRRQAWLACGTGS